MKQTTTISFLLFLLIPFMYVNTFAQLTGFKMIPGDYATISDAVTALNAGGVGFGGVTFDVAAGHTENTTAEILILAPGTFENSITFRRIGVGPSPKITRTDAGVLATSTLGGQGDAVIQLSGSDYVTFDGIDVAASDPGIEYGYLTSKPDGTNGCRNVTIMNSFITMTKAASGYVMGIYISNGPTSVSSATGVTVTSEDGRNKNITIAGNIISNVHAGVYVRGSSAAGFSDENIIVGQSGLGNTIHNFGGGSATTTYGGYFIYVTNPTFSYNTVDNAGGGGTSHASTLYGVFFSSGMSGDINASNNAITLSNSAASSVTYYIYNSNAVTNETYNNNSFGAGTLSSTGSVYMLYSSTSSSAATKTISGNSTSGTINRTGASGTFYFYYNNGSGTHTESFYDNTVSNVTLAGSSTFYGFLSTTATASTHHIYNNVIKDITGGTGLVYGIHRTLAAGSVRNNQVYNLTGGGTVYGISSGSGLIDVYKNSIYNLTSNATSTTNFVAGIYISSSSTNVNYYNNFISDLKAPASINVNAVRGIYSIATTASSTIGVYYNTIFLNASSSGTDFGSSGIHFTTSTTATSATLDLRNNIIVNKSVASGTGIVAAYRRSSTTLTNYGATSNNNLFYAGTPSSTNVIFHDGTNADQTLADYKVRVSPNDGSSFTENPTFVNSTTPPYNLHVNTTTSTQIESGGIPVTTPVAIATDFDGDARNATTPDVGADEFAGVGLDLSPPVITYAPLPNARVDSTRAITANITDVSGVATGANGPRLYYKKTTDAAFVFDASPGVSGSDYTFTFRYANLGGGNVAVDDTIQYYIAAQDSNANAGTVPAGGSGVNPPGTTPPTNPAFYRIVDQPLAGIYTIGMSAFNEKSGKNLTVEYVTKRVTKNLRANDSEIDIESFFTPDKEGNIQGYNGPEVFEVDQKVAVLMDNGKPFDTGYFLTDERGAGYPTITAAVNDLVLRGVSGAVTFVLMDTLYPSETYPIDIQPFEGSSVSNTVTFKTAPGKNVVIPGDVTQTTATFRLGGADNIIIDGTDGTESNRMLTMRTQATGTLPAFQFYSGADFNLMKGVTFESQNTSTGSGTVIWGSGSPSVNNTFDNCTVKNIEGAAVLPGIGFYFFSTILHANETMLNCDIFNFNSYGAYMRGAPATNIIFRGNKVHNVLLSSATSLYGVRADNVECTVDLNYISDLKTSSTTASIYGIHIAGGSGSTVAVSKVNNNLITLDPTDSPSGVVRGIDYWGYTANSFEGTYNTVYIGGLDATGGSSVGIVKRDAATNFTLVNNASWNARSNGTGTGAHNAVVFSNTTWTQMVSNHNSYYASGANGGVLGVYGTTSTPTIGEWITASSLDSQSLGADPNFNSTTNFKPKPNSPLLNAGIPVAGVVLDILGHERSATTPTIGAYERPFALIGWANLQWPPTATVPFGGNATVYGQIWIDGVTSSPGASPYLSAWVGVSGDNTDPSTWTTWVPSVFNVDAGNNDEFKTDIGGNLASGTYYYATRYQYSGGDFYYGGYSSGGGGAWNGTTNVSGVLTVQDPPLIINWQMSSGASTLPTWFSATASTERGFGYGKVNTSTDGVANRLVVVSRNGGNAVRLVDDSTGADAGTLDVTGISGGLFVINDADVSYKGHIYVCNMTTDATNPANPFKVYRWLNTSSLPELVISFNTATAIRLGDKFKVSWDGATNGVVVWAASSTAGQPLVYKWNQIAGSDSFNQVPTVITLENNPVVGATAAVGPLPDGSFYWNSNGQLAKKYQANGTLIDTIPGTVLATGSNAMEFIGTVGTSEFLAVFQYGTGNNNVRVLEIPNNNPELATTYGITPSLGPNSNSNGTGDVAVKHNANGSKTVFAFGTNNGFGSYLATQSIPVQLASFTANLQGSDVSLNWQTATETNSSSFEIERNSNNNWEAIGSVKVAGTSTELRNYSFTDQNLSGGKYSYRLKMIDFDGSYEYSNTIEVDVNIPMEYSLSQNFPNPFNPSTTVKFALPFESKVTVQVFAVTGELVETIYNGQLGIGYHQFEWNASRLASGMYIYRMSAQSLVNDKSFNSVKKMMLLK